MLNDKGEQIVDDPSEIVGQGTDEGSIYDDFEKDDDAINDDDIVIEDEHKKEEEPKPSGDPEPERENRLEKRLNEIAESRKATELKNQKLQERLHELEKSQALSEINSTESELDRKINDAMAKKEVYLEDNNYAAITDIDNEIYDLRSQKQTNSYRKNQVESATYQPEPIDEGPVEIPEIQKQWMEDNKWFNKMQGKTAYANETYDELIAAGYDAADPKTYDELNKRINNPGKSYATPPRGEKAPPPAAVENGDAPAPAARKNVLTNADIQKMKKWGLDVTDKAVRAEWLRNKRRAEAEL